MAVVAPIQIVKDFYAGLAKGEMAFELLDEAVEWVTPASLPWTADDARKSQGLVTYRGFEEFGRYLESLTEAVGSMRVEADDFFEMEEGRVVVIGRELGQAISTGHSFAAPFVHILTVAGGKITRLHGSVDTALLRDACGPRRES